MISCLRMCEPPRSDAANTPQRRCAVPAHFTMYSEAYTIREVPMTVIDELLESAESYREGFQKGDLALPPARTGRRRRLHGRAPEPVRATRVAEGDAHVIRNAGGVITDRSEIRSLAISQRLLGTNEIMLIHHTDCGMLTFTDEEFRRQLSRGHGAQAALDGRGVRRPRGGRAPLDRSHQGQSRSSRTRTPSAASSTTSRLPASSAR